MRDSQGYFASEGHRCCDSLAWMPGYQAVGGHHPGCPATQTLQKELQAALAEVERLRGLLGQAVVEG